jgi:hypothetical protein
MLEEIRQQEVAMPDAGFRVLSLSLGALLALGTAPSRGEVPPDPKTTKVVVKEVLDSRTGGNAPKGEVVVVLKLQGEGLEAVAGARTLLEEARDDSGRSLLPAKTPDPLFWDLRMSPSPLEVNLVAPSASARSLTVSGSVELFVPGRDPDALVRVPAALKRLDEPLVSSGLEAAGIRVTPLSKARYAAEQNQQVGKEATDRIRKQRKADGWTDEEISEDLARRQKYLKALGSGAPGHAVVLLARNEDFLKIHSVSFLRPDGTEVPQGAMFGSHDGVQTTRRYAVGEAPGPETTIVFTVITGKATVSVPFSLKDVSLR